MQPLSLRTVCAALFCLMIAPAAAQAQSMTLQFDKNMQMSHLTTGAPSAAAQTGEHTITLYPSAYSSRSAQSENIYDFDKKTFTVVNHGAKIYTVYPLHSVAIFRMRDRINRLGTKINLYQQRTGSASPPISVLTEDIDIDMMLSGSSNSKTTDKVKAQSEAGKTAYTDGKALTLATVTAGTDAVPQPLRKTYARFFVYEFTLHPAIKKPLGTQENAFKSLVFTNRDMFRNLAVTYTWTLGSATSSDAAAPVIPEDYKRRYHADAELDAAFKAALTPYTLDAAAFQTQTTTHIDKREYLQAFLKAQEARLSLDTATLATHTTTFNTAIKAAQNFEKGAYLSIVQTPDNPDELRQYVEILENAKPRAGDKAWLLDFYIARHTRDVILKKKAMSKADTEKLATARKDILHMLKNLPHHLPIYQQMADMHFAALEIPTAMLYWAHIAEIDSTGPVAKSFTTLKAETERDFPEYF